MAGALATAELSTTWHVATQRRRIALLLTLTILASLAYAALVLLLQFISAIVLLTWIVLAAVAWRPRVGLYVTFGLVLLFEPGGLDPLMLPGSYLHGGFGSTTGLSGVILSPLEGLLLLTFGSWLVQAIARRGFDFRGGQLFWPVLLFAVALVFGMVRGPLGGGDVYIGFWEARALFYIVICYVLATNTVLTHRHVAMLATIGLLANGLFAVEGAYRRVALIDAGLLGNVPEFWYGHEDVIFLSTLLLQVIAQQVFGAPRWQRLLGLLLVPIAVFTLLATERRAGYIALMVAFLAVSLVFLFAHRKAFFFIAVPVLVGGAIYLPIFWNETGLLGQPARAVRSLSQPDPRDAASNLSRELEKINVRATIEANPLLGVGFGQQFLQVVSIPDISWFPFWAHEPHHNILWIWLKTGAVGFILFWVMMGGAIARAAHLAKTLHRREARSFALLSLAGIISTLVFSYVDLGLTSGRVTVFVGITMGTLAVLDRLPGEGRR